MTVISCVCVLIVRESTSVLLSTIHEYYYKSNEWGVRIKAHTVFSHIALTLALSSSLQCHVCSDYTREGTVPRNHCMFTVGPPSVTLANINHIALPTLNYCCINHEEYFFFQFVINVLRACHNLAISFNDRVTHG